MTELPPHPTFVGWRIAARDEMICASKIATKPRERGCSYVSGKTNSVVVTLVLGMLVFGGALTAAAQSVHEVTMLIEEVDGQPVPEFFFEPVGLFIEPGDTVRFFAPTPHHSVTAYHEMQGKIHRVPDGVDPFSSPMVPIGGSWEYTFTIPGVYDVFCAPHEQFGMVMRIVVGEASGPGTSSVRDFSPMGATGAAGTVLNDPALLPERIVQVRTVPWSEISPESKVFTGP